MTAAFSFRWGVLLALIMSLLFSLGVTLPAPEQWNSEHGSLVPSKTADSAGASFGAFTGHHSRLDSCLPLLHQCLSTEDRDSCRNRFDNCLDKKNDKVATAVATASTSAPNLESSKFSLSRTVPTPSTTAVASLEDSRVYRTGAENRATMGQWQPSQSSSPGAGPTGTPGNDQDQSQDGLGQAIVVNACPFDVMSNIVHPPRPGVEGKPEEILSTLAAGATATHPFTHDPDMGISWKIWRTDIENQSPVQFEWAWIPGMQRSWWDLSMIDAGEVDWLETGAPERRSSVTRMVTGNTLVRSVFGTLLLMRAYRLCQMSTRASVYLSSASQVRSSAFTRITSGTTGVTRRIVRSMPI
ncbi:hypothetical protein LTR92_004135 [Exophiala xenobiotica]|nr:hypothetical protein LTR92_004135 [Exophiala xenobiotica]